jgi:ribonuclease HII
MDDHHDAPASDKDAGRVVASGGDHARHGTTTRPPTVDEVRASIAACETGQMPRLLRRLSADPRAGVRALVRGARLRMERDEAEMLRLERLSSLERSLRDQGFVVVAGVDEVGRGALAGPLTTCAVVLPADVRVPMLDDSKRLRRPVRERVAAFVLEHAVAVNIATAGPEEIDQLGIAPATRLAWGRAVAGLGIDVDHVLVDGNDAAIGMPATAVIGGDGIVACIAAASVVAKVDRDAYMERLALEYPGYGFEENRGYGTPGHLAALDTLGPSAVHRHTFAPCGQQERLF